MGDKQLGFVTNNNASQRHIDSNHIALVATTKAKADVRSADQPGRVTMRVNRYSSQELPKQLQTITVLVAPSELQKPEVTVVPAALLKVNCPLMRVATAAELEQWLEALRAAGLAELDQGHQISL